VRLVGDFLRVRQVVDDAVEQVLHGLVLVGRAAEHGRELERDAAGARGAADVLDVRLLLLDEHFHQLVVVVGDRFDEGVAHALRAR